MNKIFYHANKIGGGSPTDKPPKYNEQKSLNPFSMEPTQNDQQISNKRSIPELLDLFAKINF